MKTLSQLIEEATDRLWEKFTDELRQEVEVTDHNGNKYLDTISVTDEVTDFLKTELETIVKESFKNTRVEERYTRDIESTGFNSALSDKHN